MRSCVGPHLNAIEKSGGQSPQRSRSECLAFSSWLVELSLSSCSGLIQVSSTSPTDLQETPILCGRAEAETEGTNGALANNGVGT